MAAFTELDWSRFDVWAIVALEGIAVVESSHHRACLDWLRQHDYQIDLFDFREGIGPAVVGIGKRLDWEGQFGYTLGPEICNLNALRDGFEFGLRPGQGQALNLLGADIAFQEDSEWFSGLLSIAREYSRYQLALGARFFAILVLEQDSKLIGAKFETLSVPNAYWRLGNVNPFETLPPHG